MRFQQEMGILWEGVAGSWESNKSREREIQGKINPGKERNPEQVVNPGKVNPEKVINPGKLINPQCCCS